MSLSDKEIRKEIESGDFRIAPFSPNNIQPASIDLSLGDEVFELAGVERPLDVTGATKDELISIERKVLMPKEGYCLKSGGFVTINTLETLSFPRDINGLIVNRSSYARLGLDVAAAGYINPGFTGRMPLCIKNNGPTDIVLRKGMRICQLVLFKLSQSAERSYLERHNPEAFENSKWKELAQKYGKSIDNSLAEFLDERIRETVNSKP